MTIRVTFLVFLLMTFCFLTAPGHAGTQNQKPAQNQQQEFFMSLEDIPLMPGLEEIPAETLSFDKPEGRIIESYAHLHSITQSQVIKYYADALPQFGWGKTTQNKYFRGQEYLELSFETREMQTFLRIVIRPSL